MNVARGATIDFLMKKRCTKYLFMMATSSSAMKPFASTAGIVGIGKQTKAPERSGACFF